MRPSRRPLASMLATSVLIGALAVAGVPLLRAAIGSAVDVVSREVSVSVDGQQLVRLPIAASHVVVRWSGARDATVSLALGRSPNALSEEIPIEPDEFTQSGDVEAFSDVIWADGARYARVTSDRPIEHLTVVALDTDEMRGIDQAGVVDAAVNAPAVITRAGWGANESYSVNTNGYIRYSPRFAPLQKLIVHHTAGRNNDPNPAATIRAIFYDHAVLRGYGDIDYNYLIDAQGRVYEGRRAWITTPLAHPTEEDFAGNVVGGSHARHFNEATVGIVLLGNFTSVMPTAAARSSLVNLLAWKAERHGLDPKGKSTYVNPADGTTKTIYNISGHRDVSVTACPGQLFYNTFPQLRQDVANRIAATTGAAVDSKPPTVLGLKPMVPDPTGAHTLRFGLIFSEPVTGLAPEDFTVGGDSPGWTVDKITGKAATYSVTIVADESGKGPHDGTVSLTLGAGQVTDLAGLAGPADDVTAGVTFAAESEAPLADLYLVPTRGEPPNTSFEISMQFTEPVTGFGLDDIVLGGTSQAATPWKVDRYFGQDRNFNFTLYNPNPANGTLTVQIAEGGVKDLAGNPGAGSDVLQRSIDHSAPTTSAPTTTLRSGTTLNGGALRVNLTWSGSDVGPAGIASYEVARSYDGHPFTTIATGVTGTSLGSSLTPGHTYRFEVRARDKAGNLSAWKAGPTLKPALVQQTSTSVHFSGASTTTSSSSYSGGSERYLAATGSSATYTTTARALSFVTTRASTRGSIKVYIDGVLQTTVNLGGSTAYRFVAYSKVWGSVGTHTIRVVSTGSPVRVDVDAFGVIR